MVVLLVLEVAIGTAGAVIGASPMVDDVVDGEIRVALDPVYLRAREVHGAVVGRKLYPLVCVRFACCHRCGSVLRPDHLRT